MARSLFLLLVSLITVCVNPMILSATDEVALAGLNPAGVVETVPLPEVESGVGATDAGFDADVGGAAAAAAQVAQAVQVQAPEAGVYAVPAAQNYTVTAYVGSAAEYNATAGSLSYSDIYKFRKMVYGHNSANLLGSLAWKNVGEVITVTEGGVTTEYQIVWKQELYKESANSLSGYSMSSIANGLGQYDLAFVTCSGYGDTPYRWVLFANRV